MVFLPCGFCCHFSTFQMSAHRAFYNSGRCVRTIHFEVWKNKFCSFSPSGSCAALITLCSSPKGLTRPKVGPVLAPWVAMTGSWSQTLQNFLWLCSQRSHLTYTYQDHLFPPHSTLHSPPPKSGTHLAFHRTFLSKTIQVTSWCVTVPQQAIVFSSLK